MPKRIHVIVVREGKSFKKCTDCGVEKEITDFSGSQNRCKPCAVIWQREYRKRGPVQTRHGYDAKELNKKGAYTIDNERGWKKCTKCHTVHALDQFANEVKAGVVVRYQTRCRPCDRKIVRECKHRDWASYLKQSSEYQKKARKTPHLGIKFKERNRRYYEKNTLSARMSGGIRHSLSNGKGKQRETWVNLVDYTLEELRSHIGSLFVGGMTWEAFDKGEIHIDHLLPRVLFTFVSYDDPQFHACWELKNLRPMWGPDNIRKSDRLDDGRNARDLNLEEKQAYLTQKGYGYLFGPSLSPQPTAPTSDSSVQDHQSL